MRPRKEKEPQMSKKKNGEVGGRHGKTGTSSVKAFWELEWKSGLSDTDVSAISGRAKTLRHI